MLSFQDITKNFSNFHHTFFLKIKIEICLTSNKRPCHRARSWCSYPASCSKCWWRPPPSTWWRWVLCPNQSCTRRNWSWQAPPSGTAARSLPRNVPAVPASACAAAGTVPWWNSAKCARRWGRGGRARWGLPCWLSEWLGATETLNSNGAAARRHPSRTQWNARYARASLLCVARAPPVAPSEASALSLVQPRRATRSSSAPNVLRARSSRRGAPTPPNHSTKRQSNIFKPWCFMCNFKQWNCDHYG